MADIEITDIKELAWQTFQRRLSEQGDYSLEALFAAVDEITPLIAKTAQAEAREAAAPTYDLVVAAQMVLAKYLEPVDDPFPGSETALAALIRLFDGPEQRMAQAAFTPSGEPTCPGGPCKTYGNPESKCEWPSCAIRSMEVE